MPQRATWGSTQVGQEARVRGTLGLYFYSCGKFLGGDVPYWGGSETQMLGFVVGGFVSCKSWDHTGDVNNFGCYFGLVINGDQTDNTIWKKTRRDSSDNLLTYFSL